MQQSLISSPKTGSSWTTPTNASRAWLSEAPSPPIWRREKPETDRGPEPQERGSVGDEGRGWGAGFIPWVTRGRLLRGWGRPPPLSLMSILSSCHSSGIPITVVPPPWHCVGPIWTLAHQQRVTMATGSHLDEPLLSGDCLPAKKNKTKVSLRNM